jgi:hypothetical protein
MNRRFFVAVCVAACTLVVASGPTLSTHAQRHKPGVVHNLEATLDRGVAHPDKFTLAGTGLIACVRASSDVPNSSPTPMCKIAANGFTGTMAAGSNATLKAGDITLSCIGGGSLIRCDARVDITPPTQ